jgi:hypothetical protein
VPAGGPGFALVAGPIGLIDRGCVEYFVPGANTSTRRLGYVDRPRSLTPSKMQFLQGGPRRSRRAPAHYLGYPDVYTRVNCSATQTGFSAPSPSNVSFIVICAPPRTSSTSTSAARMRTRLPTGSGAGKRTLFRP